MNRFLSKERLNPRAYADRARNGVKTPSRLVDVMFIGLSRRQQADGKTARPFAFSYMQPTSTDSVPPSVTRDGSIPRDGNGHSDAQQGIRILMAEDNPINQRVGKLILQKAGFQIDLVGDGNEALEAHRANPYDLILMDCQMPTMDGFEASRQIRLLKQPQPVIVAVTANALVGERERCLNAGMDDYLSKPFQAEQLVALVRKWMSARRDA